MAADLRWRCGQQLLRLPNRTVIRNGASVQMEGYFEDEPLPTKFYIYRTYSPIGRVFLNRIGKSHFRLHDDMPASPASDLGGVVRSETFPLTATRLTSTHRWVFSHVENPADNQCSRTVRTAIFMSVSINPSLRGGVPRIGEAALSVPMTLSGPVDPDVRLTVLTPWADNDDENVRKVLREEAQLLADDYEGLDENEAYEGMVTSISDHLLTEPVEVSVIPSRVTVEAGQDVSVEIKIGTSGLRTVALALEVVDVTNEENRATSDVFVLENQAGELVLDPQYSEADAPTRVVVLA